MYVCMYTYICIYISTFYMHIYVYIYAYIHLYIHSACMGIVLLENYCSTHCFSLNNMLRRNRGRRGGGYFWRGRGGSPPSWLFRRGATSPDPIWRVYRWFMHLFKNELQVWFHLSWDDFNFCLPHPLEKKNPFAPLIIRLLMEERGQSQAGRIFISTKQIILEPHNM